MSLNISLLVALGVIACMPTEPPVGPDDPASANAQTAPLSTGAIALAANYDPFAPKLAANEDAHAAHAHAAHTGAPDAPPVNSTVEAHDHTTHATSEAPAATMLEGQAVDQAAYVCPMHPEVTSDKPGKCPKCGMDLIPNKKSPTGEGVAR